MKEGERSEPSFNKVPNLLHLSFGYHVIWIKVNTPPMASPRASKACEDSGDSSESSESDSAKHSDGSGDSNSHSGHDSDSDHRTEIDAPPVHIGPLKSKSKQKPTESSDVTTFVPDQGIDLFYI